MKKKLATAGAILATGLSASSAKAEGGPVYPIPPAPEHVGVSHKLTPEQQAKKMTAILNSGKAVANAHVMLGAKIPVTPEQIGVPDAAAVFEPLRFSKHTYGFVTEEGNGQTGYTGIKVHAFRYDGKLQRNKLPEQDKGIVRPMHSLGAATLELSEVYDVYSVSGDPNNPSAPPITGRYYAVSANQDPGNNLDGDTYRIGDIGYALEGTGGKGPRAGV